MTCMLGISCSSTACQVHAKQRVVDESALGQRAKALALRDAGSEPGQDAARTAAQELSVLATVFKHLQFAKGCAVNGQPHPATHLLQTAYPTLVALLQQQVHQHIGCSLRMSLQGAWAHACMNGLPLLAAPASLHLSELAASMYRAGGPMNLLSTPSAQLSGTSCSPSRYIVVQVAPLATLAKSAICTADQNQSREHRANTNVIVWVQHATGGTLPTLVTGLDLVFQVCYFQIPNWTLLPLNAQHWVTRRWLLHASTTNKQAFSSRGPVTFNV